MFTLFQELDAHMLDPNIVCNGYEYYLFFSLEQITSIIEQVEFSITFHVLVYWLPMYSFASILYFFICLTFVTIISKAMTAPFNDLTIRIKRGVIGIRELRKQLHGRHLTFYEKEKAFRAA